MRDHRLVRGDERLACRQTLPREGERRTVRPADQLDYGIDIGPLDQTRHIVHPFIGGQIDAPILGLVARRNRHDLNRSSRPSGNQCAVGLQQPDHAAAYRAQADYGHAQRFQPI